MEKNPENKDLIWLKWFVSVIQWANHSLAHKYCIDRGDDIDKGFFIDRLIGKCVLFKIHLIYTEYFKRKKSKQWTFLF